MGEAPAPAMQDTITRLKKAATAVHDAEETLNAERERRNQLIIEAVEQGMPQRAAARHADVSPARVIAIIGEHYADQAVRALGSAS